MRYLLILLSAVFIYSSALANPQLLLTVAGVSGSESYYATETFENSGYELGTSTPNPYWGEPYGTTDEDYSTSGLDMEGSQCAANNSGDVAQLNITASGEVYLSVKVRFTSGQSGTQKFLTINQGTTQVCRAYRVDTDKKLKAYFDDYSSATSEAISDDTSTYVRLRFKPSEAGQSNGECGVAVWTGSDWGTEVVRSDGSSEAVATSLYLGSIGRDTYFDVIKVKVDGEITDPTP